MNAKPCSGGRSRGFICEDCGHAMHTSKTIRSAPGVITRYRVCETPGCSNRRAIPTEERPRPPKPPKRRRKRKPASY